MSKSIPPAPRTFQEAATELLNLVNSYIGGKTVFLSRITLDEFSILRLQNYGNECLIQEGTTISLQGSICQLVFASRQPVIIDDVGEHPVVGCLPTIREANIKSYLGVPILTSDGEMFGTLCAVDSEPFHFTKEHAGTFEGLARFFSYVLELEHLAKVDALTGLYNRHSLYAYFDYQHNQNTQGTLMFLDLDGFKQVNDKLGHEMGDLILQEAAKRIQKVARPENMAARLGGDEFVMDFPGLVKMEDICEKARELVHVMNEWHIFGKSLDLSVSIGIVQYPEDGTDIRVLLKYADAAMYRAKEKGRNGFQFF
ncbi:sensor domain-containing diguanylate cyclase [Ectobacillus ponti]|uniref:Sensor domain-containing diguanylate cyclase n=1 Tax=Ectobacillus ponti TaxID=2961894 RepID=A0AA41XBT3_9BACI|nr:sensor domain-containing diguanylate cyclase [Ectobacillus ponti]MCP8970459.1 sensor domain-containing diguanylate cyclase [Ectobacillus ponti]